MSRVLVVLVTLLLGGCAVMTSPTRAELSAAAAATLAADIANVAMTLLPPDAASIWVEPPHRKRTDQWMPLDSLVASALRELGYAVAEQRVVPAGSAALDYTVVMSAAEVVLVARIDRRVATRYYRVDTNGDVLPASPFTVRIP